MVDDEFCLGKGRNVSNIFWHSLFSKGRSSLSQERRMSNLNNNYTVQKQIQYQIVKVDINKKKYLQPIDMYSKCGFCPEAIKSQRAQTFKGVTFDTMQLGHFLSTFSRTKPYLFTSLTRKIKCFHKISEKNESRLCLRHLCQKSLSLSLLQWLFQLSLPTTPMSTEKTC